MFFNSIRAHAHTTARPVYRSEGTEIHTPLSHQGRISQEITRRIEGPVQLLVLSVYYSTDSARAAAVGYGLIPPTLPFW